MKKDSAGNLIVRKDKHIYCFTKKNYKIHCEKRQKLKYVNFLKEIEETIKNPDCITEGPQKRKRTFYRVIKRINNNYNIQLNFWQVPTFNRKKNFSIIATAIDKWSLDWQAIHNLEKKIWKKPDSLI